MGAHDATRFLNEQKRKEKPLFQVILTVHDMIGDKDPDVQRFNTWLSREGTIKKAAVMAKLNNQQRYELKKKGAIEFDHYNSSLERVDFRVRVEIRPFDELPQTNPAQHGTLIIKFADGTQLDWFAIPMHRREELLFDSPTLRKRIEEELGPDSIPQGVRDAIEIHGDASKQ